MLAKAIFLTQKIQRQPRPLREQARSHKAPQTPVKSDRAAIRLAREGASRAFYSREDMSDQHDLILALALGLIHGGVGAAVEGFQA
ncbi:hypothetical protein CFBP6109_00100 [Pseudomonas syringae pv. cerasicola]|nr:hypothetical protein CFBP6109_00100 [Pseudomonas syringae pv. cerasicola]SPF17842.1 hypothetical protein PSCFBP6110_05399 [Pseudomonas syringae pv. cerasicola]